MERLGWFRVVTREVEETNVEAGLILSDLVERIQRISSCGGQQSFSETVESKSVVTTQVEGLCDLLDVESHLIILLKGLLPCVGHLWRRLSTIWEGLYGNTQGPTRT